MPISANVRSVSSIEDFRGSLGRFQEEAAGTISSLRQEVNRFLDYIEHDRPAFWRQEMRKAFDEVAKARSELNRKQIVTVAGHKAECIEEKQALERAKRRLEMAQQKIEICRQWNTKAHDAADEYNASLGRLDQYLGNEVPKMFALLERILVTLEAYTSTAPPAAEASAGDSAARPASGTASSEPAAGGH
jgi:hypothetical protein